MSRSLRLRAMLRIACQTNPKSFRNGQNIDTISTDSDKVKK